MLNEFLATIQHGMQNNDFRDEDVYLKTENGVTLVILPNVTNLEESNVKIDVKELEKYGFIPKPGQSGYDFVDENWNIY